MRLRLAALSCFLGLPACRPPEAGTTAAAQEEAAEPAPAPAAPEEPDVATSAASDDAAILRAVLTHERFAMYLHPEVAGRVPVVVSGEARPRGPIDLELHGAAVSIVEPAAVGAEDPVVLISKWSIAKDTARVALEYPVEGVAASFDLTRDDAGWRVVDANVTER